MVCNYQLECAGVWQIFLKDTDERACAYIAGPAPNRWGFTIDGKDLFKSDSLTVDGILHIFKIHIFFICMIFILDH